MTNSKRKSVNSGQLSFFEILCNDKAERSQTRAGRLNISVQLNAAVKSALKSAPKSRETIADEMSELLGYEITASTISNWVSESHPHRMPAEALSAFVVATGNTEPLRVISEAAGVFTLPGADALRVEIQKLDEAAKKLQIEKKKRLEFLRQFEGGFLE